MKKTKSEPRGSFNNPCETPEEAIKISDGRIFTWIKGGAAPQTVVNPGLQTEVRV